MQFFLQLAQLSLPGAAERLVGALSTIDPAQDQLLAVLALLAHAGALIEAGDIAEGGVLLKYCEDRAGDFKYHFDPLERKLLDTVHSRLLDVEQASPQLRGTVEEICNRFAMVNDFNSASGS